MKLLRSTFSAFVDAGVLNANGAVMESAASHHVRKDERRRHVQLTDDASELVSSGFAPVLFVQKQTSWEHFHRDAEQPLQSSTATARRSNWKLLDHLCTERLSMAIPKQSLQLILCQDAIVTNDILDDIVSLLAQQTSTAQPGASSDAQSELLAPILDQVFYMSQVLHHESTRVHSEHMRVHRWQALQEELIQAVQIEHDGRLSIEYEREDQMALFFDTAFSTKQHSSSAPRRTTNLQH